MKYEQLSLIQLDALREIGNIGAGNAATSMSKLIQKKVDMEVPNINIVAFDEVMEMVGGAENLVVGILFEIHGKAPGIVYLLFSLEEAELLVKQMTNDNSMTLYNGEEPNSIAFSALQEAGNILAGSYLSALSDFTNINMQPSIPHLSIDMAGAILTVGLLPISEFTDYAIIINTKMNDVQGEHNGVNGQFLLLPSPESFTKIFQALGIQDDK
ncbi:chemotaxis protein CheC [Ornithinibacillus bavariensis]|uniref:CheY-P phosphatase CheC n=1 Tax=Ornithinibacillus bavariensis TaxID=545502 RepID=A0A919X6Y5_9BACI|nr:chemotaxis protein CheC [Ornithinibacillus bavariensis]GIO26174.1 CheY-P phosphatase CheC [Ornithinibacillus bavariensis]HAM79414.1 CheY-P-specific phosphatase CheC [Ornithinibacillus sp.]